MFNFLKKNKPEVSPEYQQWREMVLGMKPTDDLKGIPEELYGVLMDVGMGGGKDRYLAISLYAFNTGEASLKASLGAGVIGLGNNSENSEHAKRIVQIGQSLIHLTIPTKKYDYPEAGNVDFYFITTSGIRFFKCEIDEIRNGHPFAEIFSLFTIIKRFADQIMEKQKNSA